MEDTSCSICSLPDDVLSLIFKSCEPLACRSDHLSTVFNTLHTDNFPWVLSHVCGRWRALALDSPLLWSTIQFDMDKIIPACVISAVLNDKAAFLLELSLQRSRNVDLRVEIRDIQDIEGVEQEREFLIASVIPLLVPTTARWGHLHISGFPDFIETFSVQPLERLQSLKICPFTESRIHFPTVPKLTVLEIDSGFHLDRARFIKLRVPWSGIRSITTPIDGLLHLLHMLKLEELHIRYRTIGDDLTQDILNCLTSEMHDISSFILPFLHTITIRDLPAGYLILHLFRRLGTPALHTLELHIEKLSNPCLPDLSGINSLKSLSLYFPRSMSSDTTIAFLSQMPSVESFTLGPRAATQAFMKAVRYSGVLPKLRTLGLHLFSISVNTEDFMALLEERAWSSDRRGLTAITAIRLASFGRWTDSGNISGRLSPMDTVMKNAGFLGRWEALREMIDISYVDRST